MDNIKWRNNFLALCLLEALDDENFENVKKIFTEHKADPNTILFEQEIAPIHYAIGCDNLEVAEKSVQFMLQHCDANPNLKCQDELTPLHIAAMNGRSAILKMLLENGGDVHASDAFGKSPVHYAISEIHMDCVKVIQNYQFELNIEKKRQVLSMVLEEPSTPYKNNRLEALRNQDGFDDYLSASQLEKEKYTPNHKNYNFKISSPYFINTVPPQRKASLAKAYEEDKENAGPEDASEIKTNLFELTEDNLSEFSKNMSIGDLKSGRSLSYIKSWREKIQSIRRYSALKENINELANFIQDLNDTQPSTILDTTIYHSAGTPATPQRVSSEYATAIEKTPVMTTISSETVRFSGSKGIVYNFDRTSPFYVNITHRDRSLKSTNITKTDAVESPLAARSIVPEIVVIPPSNETSPVAEISLRMKSPKQTDNIIIQAEGYVHQDTKNDVVFFEKKIHLNPVVHGGAELNKTGSSLSSAFTVPLDYETDMLRQELTQFGEPPGPITKTTKKIYIKKLIKYKRNPNYSAEAASRNDLRAKPSIFDDLQNTFQNPKWVDHLNVYFQYEQQMIKEFKDSAASMKREFREGHLKKSFIYLLIDPQIADNLPLQRQFLDFQQVWQRFINSIFYVGKGTADRPYAHLYDAIKQHAQMAEKENGCSAPATPVTPKPSTAKFLQKVDENVELCEKSEINRLVTPSRKKKQVSCNLFGSPKAAAAPLKYSPKVPKKIDSEKLKKILNIWRTGNGVVCLHVFHNLMPVEAYTREAAIIDCLSLQRLTNLKKGDYYGIVKLWNMKMKKKLGLAFLYRALNIYLHEGETQIMPNDLI